MVGAILFNIIFWKEKLGINTILFDAFIMASVFYLYPSSVNNKTCRWIVVGHLITAAMVIIHNTILSKFGFSITLLLFVAFAQYTHRSMWYAGGSLILNYSCAIPNLFRQVKQIEGKKISSHGIFRFVRVLVIPIILLAIFAIIYSFANKVFVNIVSDMITGVQHWLANIFKGFPVTRFFFFILGLGITSGLIIKAKSNYFSTADLLQNDRLSRKKYYFKKWKASFFADLLTVIIGKASTGILAIKNEFKIGLISIVLLNALLLFINFLDVKYVWLGFTFSKDVSLSAYVHQGAGLLILSIVLAMLVLLFFFRGNLNFYNKNKWLRYGAYLWIAQNLFLVVSVVIRDYYYITHFGLAYKRIGLLFFLAMVVAGLVTVFLKIYFIKTAYYLLRMNAWAGIFLLVCASAIHWDYTIAQYNLDRKSSVPLDVPFLLSLSDKTLPLVEKHKEVLYKIGEDNSYYPRRYRGSVAFFEERKKRFFEKQNQYSWLSWNAVDENVKKELKASQISVRK